MHEQNHHVYEFGPFHLDTTRRVLLKQGKPVKLFPKQFDTLLALVERNGEVLEKDDLMRQIWQDQIVEESNLTTNISNLRKLLGENPGSHNYIVTIPGRGYRFVAGVREPFDEVIVRERTRVTVEDEAATNGFIAASGLPGAEVHDENSTPSSVSLRTLLGSRNRSLSFNSQSAICDSTSVKRRRLGIWLGVAAALIASAIPAFLLYRSVSPRIRAGPFQNVTVEQLTTDGKVRIVALSPDGKLVAYVSGRSGYESLWLGHVGGSEPIELRKSADVRYLSVNFAPDGDSLYYVVANEENPHGALFRSGILGGVPVKLRDNISSRIAFAPDMKRFAYTRSASEGNVSSLVVADTEGAAERELVTRPGNLPFRSFSPSWSPDGTKLAVSALSDERNESWEVFIVSLADGQIQQLTALGWSRLNATAWLPDGRGLVVVGGEKRSWHYAQLWHVSYPDGAARKIISDLNNYGSSISLLSDGSMLAAVQDLRISNIWIAPADDLKRAEQITHSSLGQYDGWFNLDWTPDGRLLYGAFVKDNLTIWTMDADGLNKKQLTSEGGVDSALSVTGDGEYMVFQSNRSGAKEIWRARLDGSDLRQLTSGGTNEEPHASADGKWIVYTSARSGMRTIWRVPVEGGEPIRLANSPASWPRISPDGKLIACAFSAPIHPKRTQLAIISIEGGEPLKLFAVPPGAIFDYGIRWTPDGKALTYRDLDYGIWRQPLDGGEPKRIEGLPEERIYFYGWSRDGSQFAFVRGAELRDVVLLRDSK